MHRAFGKAQLPKKTSEEVDDFSEGNLALYLAVGGHRHRLGCKIELLKSELCSFEILNSKAWQSEKKNLNSAFESL